MLIGYARVSTDEQTTDLQIDALRKHGCETICQDVGVSGVKKRPQLAKLIDSLKAGDVLVVWRLDRLGRSLADLIQLVQQVEARGAGFRSLSEAIDTTSASGRLVFHVMGALAEFERSLLLERTRAGTAAARARGVHLGRPRSLSPRQEKHARALVRGGKSIRDVAELVGVSKSALHRALAAND